MTTQVVLCITLIISAVIGYLLGGINFAIILTRVFQRKDIRNEGSGNAGMTNVLRSVGKLPALLTFVGDFIKCVAAVLLSQLAMYLLFLALLNIAPGVEFYRVAKYVAGAGCVVGHIFPLYYGFRGGKGIVSSAAMIALADWRVFLLIIATFGVMFLWKKIISLGSIVCGAMYPVYTFLMVFLVDFRKWGCPGWYLAATTGVSLFIGVLVVVKHRANIGRLLRGEEKPIIGGKKN